MNRDYRRYLALLLSLFGMAVCSSAAHAGLLCAADPHGSTGSYLCERLVSLPPGIDSEVLYDSESLGSPSAADPKALGAAAGRGIALAEPLPAVRPGDLRLGSAWGVASGGDEAAVASAR